MPEVSVDVYLLSGLVLLAFGGGFGFFGFFVYKFIKSPEFRARLRRKKWIYALIRTRHNELKKVIVEEKSIRETDGSFLWNRGRYYSRPRDRHGRASVFQFLKKPAHIYDYNNSFPQAFVPNQSLVNDYTPAEVERIMESKTEENIVEAMRPKTGMTIAVIAILIVIVGLTGYLVYSMGNLQDLISRLLGSGGAPAPSGGIPTEVG